MHESASFFLVFSSFLVYKGDGVFAEGTENKSPGPGVFNMGREMSNSFSRCIPLIPEFLYPVRAGKFFHLLATLDRVDTDCDMQE